MAVILVAVANGAVRASIAVAAHEGGHSVFSVGDAGELVEAVDQKKPDLLFIDPGLARMDTVEPLKTLRAIGQLQRIRLVLVDDRCAEMNAWAAVARQLGEGVIDSFRKDDVKRTIDGLLGLGRMPTEQVPVPAPVPAPPAPGKTMAINKTLLVGRIPGMGAGGAIPVPPTTAKAPGAPAPAPAAPAVDNRRSILIVEDTPSLRVLLGIKLEAGGWRVAWAGSAEEGMAKIQAEGFDAVLSDINLPGMTGDQFVLTVRKLYPGVTLMLMTGLPPERRPKVPSGIPTLGKPLDMDAVLRLLDKARRAPKR
jgi:CheY-like chemotaxis protein